MGTKSREVIYGGRIIMNYMMSVVLAGLVATSATADEAGSPTLIYSPWTKICLGENCFVGRDGRSNPDCGSVVSVAVKERFGEPKKTLRVILPSSRVSLERGVRIVIDQGEPIERPYVSCFANGCMAEYEVGQELIEQLKQGRDLKLEAVDKANSPINLTVPLVDFANAHDGPAQEPRVPKVFEESAKKLQAELDEREARCGNKKIVH